MADEMRMALEALLRKAEPGEDVEFLREGVRVFSEALMEVEVARHVGAGRHERTGQRSARAGTRAKTGARNLTLQPRPEHEAIQAAHQCQQTAEFAARYAPRAGIEGTLSQGSRAFGVRKARYRGLVKTHLQHIATATTINLVRLADWLNQVPRATTRCSAFAALAPASRCTHPEFANGILTGLIPATGADEVNAVLLLLIPCPPRSVVGLHPTSANLVRRLPDVARRGAPFILVTRAAHLRRGPIWPPAVSAVIQGTAVIQSTSVES